MKLQNSAVGGGCRKTRQHGTKAPAIVFGAFVIVIAGSLPLKRAQTERIHLKNAFILTV
jgi:hypothetical protein